MGDWASLDAHEVAFSGRTPSLTLLLTLSPQYEGLRQPRRQHGVRLYGARFEGLIRSHPVVETLLAGIFFQVFVGELRRFAAHTGLHQPFLEIVGVEIMIW